jgi:16S rRNA (cytidine1402-2'-O)-methyltransferase
MSEKNQIKQSVLYIVSTPIGNLEDITLRALNILKSVDIIACEDTRHSLKLLNHYEIKKRLISYHSYNEDNSIAGIINLLNQGNSIALISDSGTPCISDPGFKLIKALRENSIEVVPIPGPSAFLTLLTASGFRTDKFIFNGFLSIKNGKRTKQLEELSNIEATLIFYESPHRILKLLDCISQVFPEKMICLGKELTKLNEKIITGNAISVKNELERSKIFGEYVILVANY